MCERERALKNEKEGGRDKEGGSGEIAGERESEIR